MRIITMSSILTIIMMTMTNIFSRKDSGSSSWRGRGNGPKKSQRRRWGFYDNDDADDDDDDDDDDDQEVGLL